MRASKRAVLLTAFIVVIISLPVFAEAVAPGQRWYVVGYVKRSGSNSPISYATVKIWNDGVYFGQVYSSSTGYFSFSTTRILTHHQNGLKVTVSKDGYYTTTRYATPVEFVTNLGNIYMNPTPPPPPPITPEINNVQVTTGGVREVTISWDVVWDDTCSGVQLACWWSIDETMDDEDLLISTGIKQASYTVTAPEDKIGFTGGTYFYKILARNFKNGYSRETYLGPESVVLDGVWRITPTDDAFTAAYDGYDANQNYNTNLLHISSGDSRAWLKFDIVNPCIERAFLYVYYNMYDPEGNTGGTVYAYSSLSDWEETSITDNNAPATGALLDTETMYTPQPTSAAYQQWDVSAAQGADGFISITLCCGNGNDISLYSKEASSYHPYLEITYRGLPESPTPNSQQSMGVDFIDDEFALRAPDVHDWTTDIWDTETVNNPETPLDQSPYFLRTNPDVPIDGSLHYQYETSDAQPSWTGHILKQDGLYIEGPFCFAAEVSIGVGSIWPEQKISLELFASGDTSPIAYIWDLRHPFYWTPGTDETHQEISGYATSSSGSDTESYFDVLQGQRYMLIIQRDISGLLKVGFSNVGSDLNQYLYPQVTLAEVINPQPITGLHLSMLYRSSNPSGPYQVNMECGYVRERKTLALANPYSGLDPLEMAIQEFDFDNSGDLTYWKDYDGSSPMEHGYIFPEPDVNNDKVWRAPTDMVQSKHWYLKQELGTITEAPQFTLGAVEGQNLAFTFLARYDSSDVLVRGVIIYQATGQTSYTVVGGDWTPLPADDCWHEINVKTKFPLPSSIDSLEVMMEGVSTNDQSFSVYVDVARLSCFKNIMMEDVVLGNCALSFGLGVVKAEGSGQVWNLDLIPTVAIECGETCHINSVEFLVEVSHGIASFKENGIVEGNNKQFNVPDGMRHKLDKNFLAFQNGLIRWGTRVLTTGLAYAVGADTAGLGLCVFLVNGIISEAIGAANEYNIQAYDRTTIEENPQARVNDPIGLVIDYDNQPDMITAALAFGWEVTDPSTYPVAAFTITVEWVDFWGSVVHTTHTILATFDYIIP